MATTKKIETVRQLTEKIGKAKSIVFADYRGLKHKQLEELRKTLAKVEAEFVVIKNKLMIRSLGSKSESVKDNLLGSTAALFNFKDEAAGIKELIKFFKTATIGKTKGGFLGETILTADDVTKLAAMPNRNELLGKLAGQLNLPIQGLHYALSWNLNRFVWALNNIKDKKTN
jgi:large subunit ribosomal protein L10